MTTSAPSADNIQDKRDLMKTYADVFTGIGEYERQYHIRLQPNASPVIQPVRTFSYAKEEKLRETLERLERKRIIASVDKPRDWVNNLVVTEKKNGSGSSVH